jgi:2-iminobutanoate/2-iminopropanoate deaminase
MTITRTTTGAEGGAYSLAVVAEGRFAYIAGHGPYRDGVLVEESLESETELTLQNLLATIEAAGGSATSIVKCNCYLRDIGDFARFDATYRTFFGSDFPARTTVGAALYSTMKVEIDAVVCLG